MYLSYTPLFHPFACLRFTVSNLPIISVIGLYWAFGKEQAYVKRVRYLKDILSEA